MAQPKPKTPPPAVVQQKTIQFREPKIVVDTETPNEVPDADLLNNTDAKIGPKTQDGTTEPTVIEEPAETKAAETVEVEKPEEEFIIVEVNPQFPGGTKAFVQFLQKNLHYPNSVAIAGVAGKVYLQFVIGKEGEISKLEVVKGIGFGCDQEAERVAKLMPHWIPGKQSGRAVSVKFTLPINFTLEN